jgi:hypothetical protein
MDSLLNVLGFLAFLALYVGLQAWLLPRLGVAT